MWGGQQGGGSRDVLESGLKGLTEFLRAPRLPGTARLNRREAAEDAAADQAGPSHGGGGSAGSSGYASSSDPSQHKQPQQQHRQQQGQQQGQHHQQQQQQQQHPHHHQQQQQQQQGATSPLAAGDGALSSALADLRMHGSGEPSTSAPEAAPAAADAGPPAAALVSSSRASSAIRVAKFRRILSEPVVDLDALRELSWSGVPPELRPLCWRLLLGYLPPNRARQAGVLLRKRREYADMVPEFYDIENSERSEDEIGALRQVTVDVPRTAPSVPFFQEPIIQNSLRRMLYIWGIRHPASGYVQGMNDLVTPFLAVFLSDALAGSMSEWGAADLTEEVMLDVEADCYWCLCRLLEGIQDHYTYAQPGIQRTVFRLKELVRKQHEPLVAHMEHEGVDFLQFAFRWVNCLLIREVPFDSALRLWDTYLAEGPGFADFLVYVCAAFLARWERQLIGLEFQELMLFLQRLPTQGWGDAEMESVLSAAFVLRNVWQHAQSHLQA